MFFTSEEFDRRVELMEAEMRLGHTRTNWEQVFIELAAPQRTEHSEEEHESVWVAHWQYVYKPKPRGLVMAVPDPRTACRIALSVKPHRTTVAGNVLFCRDCILVFVKRELAVEAGKSE